jgi:hypothetical protein
MLSELMDHSMRALHFLIALLTLAACDINGKQQTYPGASVYAPPTRDFHFHFLEPPWRPAKIESGKLFALAVDSLGQLSAEDKAISHKVTLSYEDGADSRRGADNAIAEHQKSSRIITKSPAAIQSLTGESGWDLLAYKDQTAGRAYYRDSFFTTSSKKVIRFSFVAAYALDDADIDDLVLSFSAKPDEGSATPKRHDPTDAGPAGSDRSSR